MSDRINARISEYTAWGAFVKAWGWDVAPEGAPGDTAVDQLEVCTTSCKAGNGGGAGPGQIDEARGIAVDGAGDVYIYEAALSGEENRRVQKFDSEGHFLLMLGGEVNKTTGENVCTKADVEAGEVCGAGVPGSADGWFLNVGSRGSYIVYGLDTGTIFVGDVDRIQEFDTEGDFIGGIDLEGVLDEKTVGALDIDSEGNFYLSTIVDCCSPESDVYKLDSSGKLVATFEVASVAGVAVDVDNNLYVISSGQTRKFLPSGAGDGAILSGGDFLIGLATNFCEGSERPGNLYTVQFNATKAYINAYGPGPIGCEVPPTIPPEIDAQYAISVGTDEAVVRAEINPNFFTDTTYELQYGTTPCSGGGCQTLSPATLTGQVINSAVRTAGVLLKGLAPGTTYYFRFVAESHGGGPVAGPDSTFTTFAQPGPSPPCANDEFRSGPGAVLPDCRAYEMVSPLDKNNADIVSSTTLGGDPTALHQSASSGERFTYSSSRAFADPEGAPNASQYLAVRHAPGEAQEGWASEGISPIRTRVSVQTEFFQKNQFKAFSADLCTAWLRSDADPTLAEGAVPEFPNVYRRESCGPLSYEALTAAAPEDRKPTYQDLNQQFWVEFQGASADGSHGIFVANDNLIGTEAPDIAESSGFYFDKSQLYEHVRGEGVRFVCILPNGSPLKKACAAGTAAFATGQIVSDRRSNVDNAISADGSRIFWTAANITFPSSPGQIYVRIDGSSTVRVSESVSAEPAQFWGAADDGSKAIFSFTAGLQKEHLYEFDVDTKTPQLIAKGLRGVMGMGEDASRVYFASIEALGGGAVPGEPNLYLYEAADGGPGEITFIATLSAADLFPIAVGPASRTSRVSPDGLHAAFTSTAPLTGYDNADAASGQPDSEVFLYDAGKESLACLSCNPTNARPTGKDGVAATIPPWERSLYASRALSEDGSRVFFESFEALELRDTNGVGDVYQWEADGSGDCDAGDHTFDADSGGCVELISSGESPRASSFLDASPSGDDVFITTLSGLVPQDYGLVDVYDARVGGGFPPPDPPKPLCEGEACQSPPAPPESPTPASAIAGPGNATSKPKRCPKGKRKAKRRGKAICVGKSKRRQRHRRGARR